MEKNINISFLNCNNFKSNFVFSQYLVEKADICYSNELWLKPNERNLLKDLVSWQINTSNKKEFFFKSDMEPDYNQGRPFGGQAWFINNDYKVFEAKFINKNVSFIHIGIFQYAFLMIGVLMPFESQKDRFHSKIKY